MNRNAFGFLAFAAIALGGCSASRLQSSCETLVAKICCECRRSPIARWHSYGWLFVAANGSSGSSLCHTRVQPGRRLGCGSRLLRQHRFSHLLHGPIKSSDCAPIAEVS
jgi:hypothetical protein